MRMRIRRTRMKARGGNDDNDDNKDSNNSNDKDVGQGRRQGQ
jgi:hypothetical protein